MQNDAVKTFLFYALTAVILLTFFVIAVAAFMECHERNRRRKLGLEAYNE
ncbi:MAG: hypothetical protein IJ530_10610 [Treponema sp.]|nr:hypothetical protein [Treponema sp.]MBQ8680198.1 hypothetical protein [Treponema sp.]